MTTTEIKSILVDSGLHEESVERMLENYAEMRLFFGTGRFEVVGAYVGNFCENAANIVLHILTGDIESSPSLGNILQEIERNNNDPAVDKMLRITIPRFLRAAYDMRSNRDTVHVNLEVPVNQSDQYVSVSICGWILAEFVRIYGDAEADEARELIEGLARPVSPFIDEYNGRRMIMTGDLSVPDEILIHLYNAPGDVHVGDLVEWIPTANDSGHIRTNLRRMQDRREVFYSGDLAKITPIGAEKADDLIEDHFEENNEP